MNRVHKRSKPDQNQVGSLLMPERLRTIVLHSQAYPTPGTGLAPLPIDISAALENHVDRSELAIAENLDRDLGIEP